METENKEMWEPFNAFAMSDIQTKILHDKLLVQASSPKKCMTSCESDATFVVVATFLVY